MAPRFLPFVAEPPATRRRRRAPRREGGGRSIDPAPPLLIPRHRSGLIHGVEEDPEGVEGPAKGPAHVLQRR